MSMLKEFCDFTMKGNVMDFAIGVIIGSAFGKNYDVARQWYHDAGARSDYS